MSKRILIIGVVVAAVILVALGLRSIFKSNRSSTAIPTVQVNPAFQALSTATVSAAYTNTVVSPAVSKDIADVQYQGAVNRYPEMIISPDSSVTCNLSNGNVVTVSSSGTTLVLTSTIPVISFTISATQVQEIDFNRDGWVILPRFGRMSVGHVDGMWKTDWLRGCPAPERTPDP